MASGFKTTHTVTAGVKLTKSLKWKVSRPDRVSRGGAGLTAHAGGFDRTLPCSAFHLFTFAWSQQDLMATCALATGSC